MPLYLLLMWGIHSLLRFWIRISLVLRRDEYYTVTEDTISEAFVAETLYRVTGVPELAPTVVVHYPDLSTEDPLGVEGDENDGLIEEVADSPHFGPETVEAVQAYLGRMCEPLLEKY